MSDLQERIDKTHLALGEPIAPDFTDYTRRIRNNLIIVGVISIIMTTQNVTLSAESSFLGIRFNELQTELVLKILLGMSIYFLAHFFWSALDNFMAWELRLTGTFRKYEGRFAFEDGADTTPDPSQTTLYYWWSREAAQISDHKSTMTKINNTLKELQERLVEEWADDVAFDLTELQVKTEKLDQSIKKTAEVIESTRIPASLERFDNWFRYFNNSQSWRWFWIEMFLPVAIGIIAIVELVFKIWG